MICPTCKGKKQIKIEVVEVFLAPKKEESKSKLKKESHHFGSACFTCKGKGTITKKQEFQLKRERASWCRCGNPSNQTDFHDDGELGVGSKHCWTCGDCGKLTQVG